MSQSIVFNNVTYTIPDVGDDNWGQNLTDYFVAIPSGVIQKSGGTYPLTAELNFGATYGLVSPYYKSSSLNLASAGVLRLSNTDLIEWRDFANASNLELGVDSSDRLTFNGNPIIPSTALTASRALVSDSAGAVSVSVTTAAELVYVHGVTSAIQTQMDLKSPIDSPTFTGTLTTPLAIFSSATATTVPYLDASKQLVSSVVTPTELSYVSGVTSAIQTQINTKQATGNFATSGSGDVAWSAPSGAGAVTTTIGAAKVTNSMLAGSIVYSKLILTGAILNADLAGSIAVNKLIAQTASRAAVYDASGFLSSSATTATELGFVNGVTSSIQTQLGLLAPRASPVFTTALTAANPTFTGTTAIGSGDPDVTHTIRNSSTTNSTLQITNASASTSSDSVAGITIVKSSVTTSTSQVLVKFVANSGGLGQINGNGGGSAAFGAFSDRRLKDNIEDLPSQLPNILALRPVEFDYKSGGHNTGFIAQEMQAIYPDAVAPFDDAGMLGVTGWDKTSARLVKAIQELSAKNDALETRLSALERAML